MEWGIPCSLPQQRPPERQADYPPERPKQRQPERQSEERPKQRPKQRHFQLPAPEDLPPSVRSQLLDVELLCDYDIERLRNIARNYRKLRELDLLSDHPQTPRKRAKTVVSSETKTEAPPHSVRRSPRITDSEAIHSSTTVTAPAPPVATTPPRKGKYGRAMICLKTHQLPLWWRHRFVPIHSDSSSGYRSVHLTAQNTYQAQLCVNGHLKHMGIFMHAKVAAYAVAYAQKTGADIDRTHQELLMMSYKSHLWN